MTVLPGAVKERLAEHFGSINAASHLVDPALDPLQIATAIEPQRFTTCNLVIWNSWPLDQPTPRIPTTVNPPVPTCIPTWRPEATNPALISGQFHLLKPRRPMASAPAEPSFPLNSAQFHQVPPSKGQENTFPFKPLLSATTNSNSHPYSSKPTTPCIPIWRRYILGVYTKVTVNVAGASMVHRL